MEKKTNILPFSEHGVVVVVVVVAVLWWSGVVVARWSRSANLTYVGLR